MIDAGCQPGPPGRPTAKCPWPYTLTRRRSTDHRKTFFPNTPEVVANLTEWGGGSTNNMNIDEMLDYGPYGSV